MSPGVAGIVAQLSVSGRPTECKCFAFPRLRPIRNMRAHEKIQLRGNQSNVEMQCEPLTKRCATEQSPFHGQRDSVIKVVLLKDVHALMVQGWRVSRVSHVWRPRITVNGPTATGTVVLLSPELVVRAMPTADTSRLPIQSRIGAYPRLAGPRT